MGAQDGRDVHLHRGFGDVQPGGDHLVGQALQEQVADLVLTLRQQPRGPVAGSCRIRARPSLQRLRRHEQSLDVALERHRDDPRLVAVGEIGLDYFVPELKLSPLKERQEHFYREQLKLARRHGLPVILHVRRSADALLRALRELAPLQGWRGIAHAFNGSQQQAQAFIDLGFKLGFGGAVTYERALQLRRLAAELPLSALVLETDAPDIPPHWLYVTAEQRAAGQARQPNEPAELPRIGAVVAGLRGISVEELALATVRNAGEALPRVMEGIF